MVAASVRAAQLYNEHGSGLRRLGRPEDFRQPVMIELEQQHRKLIGVMVIIGSDHNTFTKI